MPVPSTSPKLSNRFSRPDARSDTPPSPCQPQLGQKGAATVRPRNGRGPYAPRGLNSSRYSSVQRRGCRTTEKSSPRLEQQADRRLSTLAASFSARRQPLCGVGGHRIEPSVVLVGAHDSKRNVSARPTSRGRVSYTLRTGDLARGAPERVRRCRLGRIAAHVSSKVAETTTRGGLTDNGCERTSPCHAGGSGLESRRPAPPILDWRGAFRLPIP